MKKTMLFLVLLFPLLVAAQYVPPGNSFVDSESPSKVNLGIGLGLDYGGVGFRLDVLPDPHFALFGGLGYAFAGTGYNVGAKYRASPDKRFCFVAGAMYGYNAALASDLLNRVYHGTSILIGADIRSNRRPKNYGSIELIIPFRSSAVDNDMNFLRSQGYSVSSLLPVAITFGYNFGL